MNGAGNDFVLVDNRAKSIRLSREQVIRLCHRQRGIGADGLILLTPCDSGKAQWGWSFYNSDGSDAEMCGNGSRCFARFIQKLTGVQGRLTFETGAGIISAELIGDLASIGLTKPKELKLNQVLQLSSGSQTIHSLNTGVPHAVLFVQDATQAPLAVLGPEVRRHTHFGTKGTNVNFVQILFPGTIRVRTFERGVEGETLACGTGVTASALISARLHHFSSPVKVRVQGGDELEVHFEDKAGEFDQVKLVGPADFVFEGKIEI